MSNEALARIALGFVFGCAVGLMGFPITTPQYWILVALFVANGAI